MVKFQKRAIPSKALDEIKDGIFRPKIDEIIEGDASRQQSEIVSLVYIKIFIQS
jgi:hypothetical protein